MTCPCGSTYNCAQLSGIVSLDFIFARLFFISKQAQQILKGGSSGASQRHPASLCHLTLPIA